MTEQQQQPRSWSGGWSMTGRCPAWDTREVRVDTRDRSKGMKTVQVRCMRNRHHEGPHEQRGRTWE